MSEKKYQITLNETQMLALINATDFQSRIESGQLDDILFKGIPMSKTIDKEKARELIKELKAVMFPELEHNELYSISDTELSQNAKNLYDLHQTMREVYSWSKEPEGKTCNTWFDKPMKYGNQEFPLVEEV